MHNNHTDFRRSFCSKISELSREIASLTLRENPDCPVRGLRPTSPWRSLNSSTASWVSRCCSLSGREIGVTMPLKGVGGEWFRTQMLQPVKSNVVIKAMYQSRMWCCVLCYEIVTFIFYGTVLSFSIFYLLYWFQQTIDRLYLQLLTRRATKLHTEREAEQSLQMSAESEMGKSEVGKSELAPEGYCDSRMDVVDVEYTYDGTWSCGDSLQVFHLNEGKP
ncbi:hypothetical protein Btru_046800 [Bulinus truncatus]|nr:hypothetical protein Btru_046800 [Bulinus truncatus]